MNTVNRFLLEHNRQQSDFFRSSDEVNRRDLYSSLHPTLVMIQKCMDGRVNVPVMTDGEVPMGIISPYRNMGGKFVIGSPSFAHYVRNFHEYVLRRVKETAGKIPGGLNISTYHYSASDRHQGCKGFDYDTGAARAHTAALTNDFAHVFGEDHAVVHPIQMGIETDLESFVFHGHEGRVLNIADVLTLPEEGLRAKMRELYPGMKQGIFNDLMPFAVGNQRHVNKVFHGEGKPLIALQHTEQIIGVGRGFDWLHLINKALIVGPFSVGWLDEVAVAARIVLDNFEAGRIPLEDGAVLLISAPYRDDGVDAEVAKYKALEMARMSWDIVERQVPALLDHRLELVAGVLDRRSMLLQRLELPKHMLHAADRVSGQRPPRQLESQRPRLLSAA